VLVQCYYQGLKGFTASELETLIVLGIELVLFYVVLLVLMIVMYRVMKKVCDHNFGCSMKFFMSM
jgi:hypothetical protein